MATTSHLSRLRDIHAGLLSYRPQPTREEHFHASRKAPPRMVNDQEWSTTLSRCRRPCPQVAKRDCCRRAPDNYRRSLWIQSNQNTPCAGTIERDNAPINRSSTICLVTRNDDRRICDRRDPRRRIRRTCTRRRHGVRRSAVYVSYRVYDTTVALMHENRCTGEEAGAVIREFLSAAASKSCSYH
jgi:hypothetical protein